MSQKIIPPTIYANAFHCPHINCGVYARQLWSAPEIAKGSFSHSERHLDYQVAFCEQCQNISLWSMTDLEHGIGHIVYPITSNAPLPDEGMPNNVSEVYEEARQVCPYSPRSACALLRLCLQMLCKHLNKPGKNINSDIGSLVEDGLPQRLQQILDIVRVVGNNAVHPGEINLEGEDGAEMAYKLFR